MTTDIAARREAQAKREADRAAAHVAENDFRANLPYRLDARAAQRFPHSSEDETRISRQLFRSYGTVSTITRFGAAYFGGQGIVCGHCQEPLAFSESVVHVNGFIAHSGACWDGLQKSETQRVMAMIEEHAPYVEPEGDPAEFLRAFYKTHIQHELVTLAGMTTSHSGYLNTYKKLQAWRLGLQFLEDADEFSHGR